MLRRKTAIHCDYKRSSLYFNNNKLLFVKKQDRLTDHRRMLAVFENTTLDAEVVELTNQRKNCVIENNV